MGAALPEGLHGEIVVLRRFRREDAGWIAAACDRPEMARFVPVLPAPYTEADAREYIDHTEEEWRDGTGAAFAIESCDGEPLGAVALARPAFDPGIAGIGYWLRPEARGRGAATEAVRLVAGWAFDELGVQRVSLITDPENLPSQRVAERAGFTREGLLRAWHPTRSGRRDSVMFSRLRGDRR